MIDPVRFEVARHALTAIADEMAVGLRRAAYSTNIKTRLDFSCALFDAACRSVAQSFTIPIHLGSLTRYVPAIVEQYGAERLRPGDVLVCNDGHRGGVHLNDVVVVAPFFADGEIAAYAATLAHHVDVGGANVGSIGLTTEVYQEGLIVPPVRLDGNVLALILANVRSPRETGGDLRAQVAGVNIACRRLGKLVDKLTLPTLRGLFTDLFDYTERRARAAIREIPNGVYRAEGFMDGDGITDEPVRIVVEVSVEDEHVVFDLTGSDAQRPGPLNATFAMTVSNCAYPLRCLMDPDLPTNDGFYRTFDVVAPPATVVNARHPAAIGAGWETAFRVCETVFAAFAQVVPERVTAGSKGCLCNVMFGGVSPRNGEYFTFFDSLAGGYGARATQDGIDAVQPHVQNTENAPVEETEANYPVRIVRYQLVPDSEGAGRWRGGLGLRRDYAFEGEVRFSVMADRARFAPEGLSGGLPARAAHYVRNPGGNAVEYGSKLSVTLAPGEVFSVQMAGGGGYGDPRDRDPHRVREDVLDGKVSAERARDVYGL